MDRRTNAEVVCARTLASGSHPRDAPLLTRFDARLCATSGLRPLWRGRIVQRFAHAAVVERDGGDASPGPRRVTLLHPSRELVPWGIVVSGAGAPGVDSPGAEAPRWDVPGSDAIARDGILEITGRNLVLRGPAGACRRFVFHGTGVHLTAERLQPRTDPAPPGERERIALLHRQLAGLPLTDRTRALLDPGRCRGDDLEARGLRLAGRRLRALLEGIHGGAAGEASASGETLARCARALVGLGPGATPTGDDLLVGALAGAWRLEALGLLATGPRCRFCQTVASLSRWTTTPPAWEMLQEAAGGAFPEPLLRLARLLGAPRAGHEPLAAAVGALSALGSRSGADMAAGLVGVTRGLPPGRAACRRGARPAAEVRGSGHLGVVSPSPGPAATCDETRDGVERESR